MASKAVAAGEAFGFFPPTEKSLMLFMATAGSEPLRMRGTDGPSAIARNGEFWAADGVVAEMLADIFADTLAGMLCSERLSHPSSVIFTPGVPVSMKSCASKCERVVSGDPAACTMARCPCCHSG